MVKYVRINKKGEKQMNSELTVILNGIKERTGIDVGVFGESKKFCVSTGGGLDKAYPDTFDFDGAFSDEKQNKTFFKIKYRNASLVGVIEGVGKIAENYAYFIVNLIENSSNKELQLSQTEYLKIILLGECNKLQIQRYMRKYAVPQSPCIALVIMCKDGKTKELMSILSGFGTAQGDTAIAMEDGNIVFVKFEENSSTTQTATDFAEFLLQSVYEETGLRLQIALGCTVNNMLEIATSYQQAMTTMRTTLALNSKGEIHTYKEFVLVRMLEDIPEYKLSEYLSILDSGEEDIFSDAEMINTAEEFLENSLNVSETSRNLYLHRNTLTYRLDKIEKATGLNIRKFSDAVTFRLITILYKLIK